MLGGHSWRPELPKAGTSEPRGAEGRGRLYSLVSTVFVQNRNKISNFKKPWITTYPLPQILRTSYGSVQTAGAVSQPCRQIHEIFGYNLSIWLCSWLGTFKPLIDYSSADLRLTLWWIMHTVGPISLMEITLQTMIIVPRAYKSWGVKDQAYSNCFLFKFLCLSIEGTKVVHYWVKYFRSIIKAKTQSISNDLIHFWQRKLT